MIRRRLLALGTARGAGWALVAFVALLIAWMWLDLILDLTSSVRAGAAWVSIGIGVAIIGRAALAASRQGREDVVAQRLDAVAGTSGQILTGVDLSRAPAAAGVTGELARLAVQRASQLVGEIAPARAAPARVLRWPWIMAGVVVAVTGMIALSAPRMASALWARFTDPYGDHPPYSRVQLIVEPGDVRVVYGQGFDVSITTQGGLVEKAEVVIGDGAGDVLPMFNEGSGKWRATLANVTAASTYRVQAPGSQSRKYAINVITVPRLEGVRVRVTPPAYTNRPPYEGAIPQEGLAGLAGTTVELFAKSNRPLSGGIIQIDGEAAGKVAMIGSGGNDAAGKITLQKPGKLTLRVTDTDGQTSTDAISAPITLLTDERPFVRLVQPMQNSYATPTTILPMEVIAEDDYGVSRVQIFRSLNDSRAMPLDLPVPHPPVTRLPLGTKVELSKLGVKPGDTIKVFARVEDNDPAGAKGSESTIAVVHIIAESDLKRMMLAREGMEVLQGKYAEARRRIEGAAEEIKKLQEELAKKEAKGEVDEELRKKIEELADRMAKDAAEIRRAAQEDLPFDLDKKLTAELEQLAKELEQAAEQLAEAGKKPGQNVGDLAGALGELAKRMGAAKGKFNEEVTLPLEHLARIFPLIEAQARFIALHERQKDLADRLAANKDKEKVVDPKEKARMRDLEEEQQGLKQELIVLLDDIEQYTLQIPEEQFKEMRESAQNLVKEVRESRADEAMREAHERLADFDGMRGHGKAKEAEEILDRFIAKARGMGDAAGQAVVFQPRLADGIGNTIDQLLGAEGLSRGNGAGGGSGYTARRSTMRNVGMYGDAARMARASKSGGGKGEKGMASDGRGGPNDRGTPGDIGVAARETSTGESDATVPTSYKRRVGDYFRRVADEINEK